MNELKKKVYDFWNENVCGEELYLKDDDIKGFEAQKKIRYQLEPYILEFMNFGNIKNERLQEIGVGLGADHEILAKTGCELYGIDLTDKAIEKVKKRNERDVVDMIIRNERLAYFKINFFVILLKNLIVNFEFSPWPSIPNTLPLPKILCSIKLPTYIFWFDSFIDLLKPSDL